MKNKTDELSVHINVLKNKQFNEWILLKEQFHITYENLRPVNLLKNTFYEVANSPEIKDNLVNNAIGLTTGYLSRKILVGATHNPIRKLFGAILQFAIANFVSKHSGTIKETGENILEKINKYRKDGQPVFHHNGKAGHTQKEGET